MRPNVRVVTRERGKIVAVHEGHNIMTDYGRELMAQLVSWETIDDTLDVAHHNRRIRWLAAGTGLLPETTSVHSLQTSIPYTGSQHLAPVNAGATVFLNATTARLQWDFTAANYPGSPIITEMGLYQDVNPPIELNPNIGTNELSFYKTFPEGILKLPTMTMTVTWELRF